MKKDMKFSQSDVFEMVDALFHCYASDYRIDAKEQLATMMLHREANNEKVKDYCPDYAYTTLTEYEDIVGYKVGEAFKIGWEMARLTNANFNNLKMV